MADESEKKSNSAEKDQAARSRRQSSRNDHLSQSEVKGAPKKRDIRKVRSKTSIKTQEP